LLGRLFNPLMDSGIRVWCQI